MGHVKRTRVKHVRPKNNLDIFLGLRLGGYTNDKLWDTLN